MRERQDQTQVVIHVYRFQDLNILLDVGSGAVHVVSRVVSDILSFFERSGSSAANFECEAKFELRMGVKSEIFALLSARYTTEELSEAFSDIEQLAAAGMLFAADVPQADADPEQRGAVIKALCLHAAHDCNMRCAYCFAGTGDYAGERALLSLETGKRAIDFLLRQSGKRRNLEIDFFGGEPLMNFEVVKALVHYGRERECEFDKHIRFTLTTNGLLLDDEKTAFLNEHMDNVILSIDGRPEVNDRMRKTPAGDGSYAQIIGRLKHFTENRKGIYYVRGTYTAYNKDFSEDVRHLVDLGFRNVSVEPVVTDETQPYALRSEDAETLAEEYERLAALMTDYEARGEAFSFFHYNVDLAQGPCVYKRAAGCGAGTEYVAVAANGDIYPCHQFVGEDAYRLGNVHDDSFENRLYAQFNRAHIYNKTACQNCWAKYYCSGGCHANALHTNDDIMQPYELGCVLEKKRLECAIGLSCRRAFNDEAMREKDKS